MADQASLFDRIVKNEDVPIGLVSFLLFAKIGLITLVGGAFFALNAGSLPIIAVIVAFIGALVYSRQVGQGSILRTSQTPGQEALAYWLPQFIFFLPGVVAILEGFVAAFAGGQSFAFSFGASETYLSFIADAEPWFVDVVNYDLATHVENWLIIPSGAVIYSFLQRFSPFSKNINIGLAATPMAIIFALLHGVSALAFFLFAFGFMFLLIVSIGFEDSLPGKQIPLGLASLAASIGFHRGFNIGGLDTLIQYYGELLSLSGDFLIIGVGIVGIDLLILAFAVWEVISLIGDRF